MKSAFYKFVCLLLPAILLMLMPVTLSVKGDDPTETKQINAGFENAWQTIHSIAERLTAEHLRPPTRQQMFVSACRGLFVGTEQLPPRELSQTFSNCVTDEDFQRELKKIWDQQASSSGLNSEQLQRVAINAMLFDCEPGIQFIDAKNSRVQKQLAENQYVGIGIRLAWTEDGWPRITQPFYGGAAQKAVVARVGDLIVAIDGETTKGRDFGEVIDLLRGSKGTQLSVSFRHESESEVREKTMTRDVIPLPSIIGREQNQEDGKWDISLSGHPDIAHLKFESIVGSTAAEMMQMARQIEKGNFTGVILDFRGQRNFAAAQTHHAIMLIDSLLSNTKVGEIITPESTHQITTQSDSVLNDLPMVVLSDPAASGPLFLILSSLVDNGRHKLVGIDVQSNGLCRKSIELENGMGALDGVSYGLAVPYIAKQETLVDLRHVDERSQAELGQPTARFRLRAQVQINQHETDPESFVEAIVKALNN